MRERSSISVRAVSSSSPQEPDPRSSPPIPQRACGASEIGAELLLKATQVDGVYDRDPKLDDQARRYERISYDEVLADRLQVMDAAAIALCREQRIPLLVFDIGQSEGLCRIVMGDITGATLVHGGEQA